MAIWIEQRGSIRSCWHARASTSFVAIIMRNAQITGFMLGWRDTATFRLQRYIHPEDETVNLKWNESRPSI